MKYSFKDIDTLLERFELVDRQECLTPGAFNNKNQKLAILAKSLAEVVEELKKELALRGRGVV